MSGRLGVVQSLLAHGATVDRKNDVGDTALHEACFEGRKTIAETLVERGANGDARNVSDVTCLMIGTYADNADVIKYLVERGVNVNDVDRDGRNVLFYVASDGQLDTLAYLLDNGACVRPDNNHVTILMEAVLHGHVDMVEYLIRYDRALGLSPDDADSMGRNALFYLVNSDDFRLLDALLEWGVLIAPSGDGRTLLMNAALRCNAPLVRYLVDNAAKLGVDADERDAKDRNCLFYCVTGGDLELFGFLVDGGAAASASDDGVTLLMQAVAKNRADFTLKLLQEGATYGVDVNALDDDGWDAAMYAVASGHVHLFKMLVLYGARCHVAADGRTVLMQAAAKGDVGFVRHLLDNGSEFQVFGNQRDVDGWNALFYTVQGGHMETFKFLLARGTKVCRAHNGATILMEAVDKKRPEFADYLLANASSLGIDVAACDNEGNNVLFYAAAGGHVATLQRLLKAGCPVKSDAHGRTLLMQAVLHGHVAMTEFLINNSVALGIDIHQKDKDMRNVIFYCVEGGHLEVLKLLFGVRIMPCPDAFGRTNLMQAARAGHMDILEYLLDKHASLGLDINGRDKNGENALFYSIRSRDLQALVTLLQHGVKVANNQNGIGILAQSLCEGRDATVQAILTHALDISGAMAGRDSKGRTVLHHYVERGDLEMLHSLSRYYRPELDADLTGASLLMVACRHPEYLHVVKYLTEALRVDPDRVDFRGRCALFYAVESSNLAGTAYLLDRMTGVESDKDGLSPLMVAIASGDHAVVDALLQSKLGRILINRRDRRGRNEVHYCAVHGHSAMLERLQHYGSDLDVGDRDGLTPVMCACANGRFRILQLLLRKGADLDAADAGERNAAHHCFGSNPTLNCVKVLVKFGADINRQDARGVSPLMLACQTCAKSMISVIRFLVDYGADPVAQDEDGKDAFDYCPFDAEYVKAFMRDSSVIDSGQWEAIQKYRGRLIQDIELNSVLRGLIREKIFTKTLHFEVMKRPSAERVERLLEILRMRGSRAFRAFCRVLREDCEIELSYCMMRDAYRKDREIFW